MKALGSAYILGKAKWNTKQESVLFFVCSPAISEECHPQGPCFGRKSKTSRWFFCSTFSGTCPQIGTGMKFWGLSTGGASPRFGYATPPPPAPPPPPCPPGPLSYQGSIATGHTYGGAEGARKFFFHSPCPHSIPPRPGGGAPQRYT